MSTDANQPAQVPAYPAYVLTAFKKLWLFPTLAFVLVILGEIFDLNENWDLVTVLVAFPTMFQLGRLLATKKLPDNSHMASGNQIFWFMSLLQAALMVASFISRSYVYTVLLFALMVAFVSLYLWGADVNHRARARRAAGES